MPAVSLILPITVDVSSNDVQIFGEQVDLSNNYLIEMSQPVFASLLAGTFYYKQSSGTADDVEVWPANGTAPDGLTVPPVDFTSFKGNLSSGLESTMTASGSGFQADYASLPNSGYDASSPFYSFPSIYELFLSRIAFDVFGHPLAVAGIQNDSALLDSMRKSGTDKDIPSLLADAMNTLSAEGCKLIYEQILRQDSSRFENVNDKTAANPLQINAGDDITFALTLKPANLIRGAVTSVASQTFNQSNTAGESTSGKSGSTTVERTYTLKVNLVAGP
jgi:hypothetical protein